MKSAQVVRHGIISIMARNFGATRNCTGSSAIVSQRVDFFVHLHRADFGGERRAGTADHHDRRHQRAQFARHRNGHRAGHQLHARRICRNSYAALQRQDQSHKEGDQRNDRKRFARPRPSPDESRGPIAMRWPRNGCDENRANRRAPVSRASFPT